MGLAPGRAALACVLAGACSGGKAKTKAVEDGPGIAHADPAGSAAPADAGPLGPYRVETKGPTGEVAIHVAWQDVPRAMRASPGRTPCGTARAPAVSPSTMWGIPDVLVVVLADHGKAPVEPDARVVLEPCAVVPRLVVAGTSVSVASASETPARLVIRGEHEVRALGGAPHTGASRTIYLPTAGHEVDVGLEPGTVYRLGALPGTVSAAGAPAPPADTAPEAIVVAADTPYVAVTDASGQALMRDVPVGSYAVQAWLPARAGQDAHLVAGQVTVEAGHRAEVTLDLGKS